MASAAVGGGALPEENLQKCGEILTAIGFGRKVYALNCMFCGLICLQLEKFALHIEEQHLDEFHVKTDVFDEVKLVKHEHGCAEFVSEELQSQSETKHSEPDELPSTVEANVDIAAASYEDPLEEVTQQTINTTGENAEEETLTLSGGSNNGAEDDEHVTDGEHVNDIDDDDMETEAVYTESDSASETDDYTGDASIDTDNRELTSAIIAGYEKNRLLWDDNKPMARNRRKREVAFTRIASTIKKEMGLNFTWKAVRDCIKKMRYKFRTELHNRKVAQAKHIDYTPLWYYDKLLFLEGSIKFKRRSSKNVIAATTKRSALPLPHLTEDQNFELIAIYESFPCLWNEQNIGFRFKNQRQEALEKMLATVKSKMYVDITLEDLQKKISRIRYACTQEKRHRLQCERLNNIYKPSSKYFEKIAYLHEHVGPFKCEFCETVSPTVDQYKIHKSQHDGSMPFTCPICNRGFMRVGNCTVHLRRHTRDYPFECKVCGKRYATTTDVNVHLRHHTGEKPYFCEICGQSFRTWTFFDSHMRRHQKRPLHKCTICSKDFYENNRLKEHMKAHLNVRDRVCNVCGKAFTTSKYLRQHKQIHAEKKRYVCKICSKEFAQYAGLSGHMKSHGTTVSGVIVEEKQC